ncbi:hypothetical protein C9374_003358 [Naegleria lovaniensis]|uniref:Alkaline phosphatase n=1 Tax=Naegleria lovaniensis TaxID=51637 RepID=A0AA88GT36_NAELO|nr:uncharacterized protein C9374_003358 [Naegleria lovaniensis]KAG2385543.1 hypothetical protein C9374_003358 [Naegleria lovaniensis]
MEYDDNRELETRHIRSDRLERGLGGISSSNDGNHTSSSFSASLKRTPTWMIYMLIGMGILVMLSLTLNIVLYVIGLRQHTEDIVIPKNVIFMIGDGFGPAAQTFARVMMKNSVEHNKSLALDSFLVGSSRTFSSDSDVTDSAAGATAFSCALKSYNGAIGVDPSKKPCGTLLEAALKKGMRTGLVATNPVTDATPAAFSAHVSYRSMQDKIAYQQIRMMADLFGKIHDRKYGIDIILGGGRSYFLPKESSGSLRKDSIDLVQTAKDQGYQYVTNVDELLKVDKLPLLGLFAPTTMKYTIDRLKTNEPEPTLPQMTTKALELISKDNKNGFFLMVEGSRIDHCAHSNDIACQWQEVIAYNEAFKIVQEFAANNPDTLVISTADHETGGITLNRDVDGDSEYAFYTEQIRPIKHSTEYIANLITDPTNFTQVSLVLSENGIPNLTFDEHKLMQSIQPPLMFGIDEVINRRARIGFSTRGHTAVDVNVYSFGPGSQNYYGNRDNTDLGKIVANLLGFNLTEITTEVNTYLKANP